MLLTMNKYYNITLHGLIKKLPAIQREVSLGDMKNSFNYATNPNNHSYCS